MRPPLLPSRSGSGRPGNGSGDLRLGGSAHEQASHARAVRSEGDRSADWDPRVSLRTEASREVSALQAKARSRMRAARRAATYAGRTTCSTKYMRKRTSPPVSATDASAQSDASIARIRARTHAANATQTGTTTPTRIWPDPGPLPGGFGIEPPALTPRIGATIRQIGASQTRGRNLCVASASTRCKASAPETGT